MTNLLNSLAEGFETNTTKLCDYVEMLHEWTRMFKHLGSGFAFAFKDVSTKGNTINSNVQKLVDELKIAEKGSDQENYLQAFVALEKAENA